RTELGGGGDPGRVEDQPLVPLTLALLPGVRDAEAVEAAGEGEPALAADDDGAVHQGRARRPPVQLDRIRQTEVLDQQLPDRGLGEGLVAVAHGEVSLSTGMWNRVGAWVRTHRVMLCN